MKMKNGDFFDRWTILLQKSRFDENAKSELAAFEEEMLSMIADELGRFHGVVPKAPNGMLSTKFLHDIAMLSIANAKIWELEASIRQEHSDDPAAQKNLSTHEIGERTLQIRQWNKVRCQAKNSIDELFGDTPDTKVNHASE